MQSADESYMLYGLIFVFLFLGLLYNVAKRLGSSKNFPRPKDKKNKWITTRRWAREGRCVEISSYGQEWTDPKQ